MCTLTPNQRNTFPPCGGLARFQKWIAHVTEFHGDYFAPLPVPSGPSGGWLASDCLVPVMFILPAGSGINKCVHVDTCRDPRRTCAHVHRKTYKLTWTHQALWWYDWRETPSHLRMVSAPYKVWYPYCTVRKLFQYNSMHVQDRVHGHMYLQATR